MPALPVGAAADVEVFESGFVLVSEDAVTVLNATVLTAEAVFPDDENDGCSVTAG